MLYYYPLYPMLSYSEYELYCQDNHMHSYNHLILNRIVCTCYKSCTLSLTTLIYVNTVNKQLGFVYFPFVQIDQCYMCKNELGYLKMTLAVLIY